MTKFAQEQWIFCCSLRSQLRSLLAGAEYLVASLLFLRLLGKVRHLVNRLWKPLGLSSELKGSQQITQYVGLHEVNFLNWTFIFVWYMARLVVKSGHSKTCVLMRLDYVLNNMDTIPNSSTLNIPISERGKLLNSFML